jgi:RNA polymerase sigma-70 factor, ECF subfamily
VSTLEEAAARLRRGESAAFQALVDATSEKLVRLAARMLGNVADAEDVVQEAYVKAYTALVDGRFDGRSRVETWLYRIVVNGTLDAKRKRERTATREFLDAGWDGAASAEAVVALRELAGWLDLLPDEQQTVLVLKAVEGMSSAEIAIVLDISEGAVEQRLVRARTTLRDMRDYRDPHDQRDKEKES